MTAIPIRPLRLLSGQTVSTRLPARAGQGGHDFRAGNHPIGRVAANNDVLYGSHLLRFGGALSFPIRAVVVAHGCSDRLPRSTATRGGGAALIQSDAPRRGYSGRHWPKNGERPVQNLCEGPPPLGFVVSPSFFPVHVQQLGVEALRCPEKQIARKAR
jgi:hypothetical protein